MVSNFWIIDTFTGKIKQELIKQKLSIIYIFILTPHQFLEFTYHSYYSCYTCFFRKVQATTCWRACSLGRIPSNMFFHNLRTSGVLTFLAEFDGKVHSQIKSYRPWQPLFLVHQSLCDTVRSEDGKDLGSNTGENTSQTAITWSSFREVRVSKCFLSSSKLKWNLYLQLSSGSGTTQCFGKKKCLREGLENMYIYIYIYMSIIVYIYIYVYSSMPCSVIDDSILSREASRPWGRNTAVKFAHREQHWCLPRDVSSLPSNTEATYYYGFKHIPVTSWNNHVWQKSPVSSERFLCRKFEIPLRNSPPDFSLH